MRRIPTWTITLALSCAPIFASAGDKPIVTPVQAELMSEMHANGLKVGATVFASVSADWQDKDCVLMNGAILEGHVVAVVPATKTAKGSEIDLAFTKAQCMSSKNMGDFALVLVALAAPPPTVDLGMVSGTMNYVSPVYHSATLEQSGAVPRLQMGEVSGIRGLKMRVGSGPENSTVLSSKDHNVTLDRSSLLLLVPAKEAFVSVPGDAEAAPAAPGDAAGAVRATDTRLDEVVPARPPDVDICAPPQCSQELPTGDPGELGNMAASISIGQFGYAPRPQRVLNNFDHDEGLAYLGPRELLVAFNPHALLERHNLGPAGWTERVIRAVLVDTDTRLATHAVEWEIPDSGQYLWPLPEGRVLVHVGSELRVYGEGLKILSSVAIDGPLAFVREAPDGAFLAVGVIRERHTPELHAQLSRSLGGNPEEDVEIRILNRKFETVATSTARSGLMAPTLLNEGQARLMAQPNMRYRISMQTRDNHASTVALFNSSCVPLLSSIAPDLLFMVSCNKLSQGPEYRVLRANGRAVLQGVSNFNEFGFAAGSSDKHDVFVVKVVQSNRFVPSNSPFSSKDLSSEELSVYRTGDGKRLLKALVGSPSLSRDGFALSPDSAQLAVLTRDQIVLYTVPSK